MESHQTWEERVAEAIEEGCEVIAPNNLPIMCQRAFDGALLEHEHASHPDYMFPIKSRYFGNDPEMLEEIKEFGNDTETHAVIYCDGIVAVTMYECNYAMWYTKDGTGIGRYVEKDWRIIEEDLVKLRALYKERT